MKEASANRITLQNGLLSFHVLGDSLTSLLRARAAARVDLIRPSRSYGARACGWENRPASAKNALEGGDGRSRRDIISRNKVFG
jgi:hypothetical protein